MTDYVDIVFDGPPHSPAPRFVEVEDSKGRSIKFGEWVERDDGYWCLRVSNESGWDKATREALIRQEAYASGLTEKLATITKLEAAYESLEQQIKRGDLKEWMTDKNNRIEELERLPVALTRMLVEKGIIRADGFPSLVDILVTLDTALGGNDG